MQRDPLPAEMTPAQMLSILESDRAALVIAYPEGINRAAIIDYLGVSFPAARAVLDIARSSEVYTVHLPRRSRVGGEYLWPTDSRTIALTPLTLFELRWLQRVRSLSAGGGGVDRVLAFAREGYGPGGVVEFRSLEGDRTLRLDEARERELIERMARIGCFGIDHTTGIWTIRRSYDSINESTRTDYETEQAGGVVEPLRSRNRGGRSARAIPLSHLLRCIAADHLDLRERFPEGITSASISFHYGCSVWNARLALNMMVSDRGWRIIDGFGSRYTRYWPADGPHPVPLLWPRGYGFLAYLECNHGRAKGWIDLTEELPAIAKTLDIAPGQMGRALAELERRGAIRRSKIRGRTKVIQLRSALHCNADTRKAMVGPEAVWIRRLEKRLDT